MAEFQKIMKIKNRLCNGEAPYSLACRDCPISSYQNGKNIGCPDFMEKFPEAAESILLAWDKANPELVYPTYGEAWREKYPDAYNKNPACPTHIFSRDVWPWCEGYDCSECYDRVLTKEQAEILGVEPRPAKEE